MDEVACKIGQGVVVFVVGWIFPLALHVDEVVGVDLQTRLVQHPLVTSNAETDKCVQFLLLQEVFEALGPARGETHIYRLVFFFKDLILLLFLFYK